MISYSGETPINLEALRARLGQMTDAELLRYGRAGAYLCTPEANHGRPPREVFVIQAAEARAEWRRRKRSTRLLVTV